MKSHEAFAGRIVLDARRTEHHSRSDGRGEKHPAAQIALRSDGRWNVSTSCFQGLGTPQERGRDAVRAARARWLSIRRALARDIKVQLLDEPYEGLAPVIARRDSKRHCTCIKQQGITTILVEQNAVRALKLADRAVILGSEVGKSCSTAPPIECAQLTACATVPRRSRQIHCPLTAGSGKALPRAMAPVRFIVRDCCTAGPAPMPFPVVRPDAPFSFATENAWDLSFELATRPRNTLGLDP